LETKEAERVRNEAELPHIEADRQALNAAKRAAEVIPVLQQADTARLEEEQRQQALQQAAQNRDQRRAEHQAATTALEQATEAVASLPDLRRRLDLLNIAKGKLGLRDQLIRQLEEHQPRHRTLVAERAATAASIETFANDVAAIVQDISQTEKNLEAIGFNEEHYRRLVIEQPTALRLQSDRLQLAVVRDQAQQDELSAANLAVAAEDAGRKADQEGAAAGLAGKRMEEAEEALRAAEAAHAASHLRAGLQPGHPCPVCLQEVLHVPADEMVPELDQLREALTAAKRHFASAHRKASQAAKAFAAARATSDATRIRTESSCSELTRRQQDIALREQTLLEKLDDSLDRNPPIAIEEQVLATARRVADCHALHLQAANRLSQLQTKLALKGKDHETELGRLERLDEDLRVTAAKMATETQSLSAVRKEIYEAGGTDEPGAESERLEGEIDRLEADLARTAHAERTASDRLCLAESLANNCTQEVIQASTRAAAARTYVTSALQKAGFTDISSARAAHLTTSQVQAIQERITEYEAIAGAVGYHIAELETALQGRRISAEEYAQAERAYEGCAQRRKIAETQAALFGQQLQEMQARLERAKQLREELAEQERLHRIFDWLARDLCNDRFQAYLLEETLIGLVSNASCQLTRLTGERYGLAFEDDRIIVLDHDNAGEHRGIETLSGGELFLASLALALALSEQVQQAAGAVHLDCLFIDEGFGTLDPETLRTVSDAIRGLQIGGRMVGIITHMPELKEEFDQRLVVEKRGGSSRVQIDVA
jgi:exonuclease SbcC